MDQIKQYIKSGNQLQEIEDDFNLLLPVDHSYMLTLASKTKPSPITFISEKLNELGVY